MNTNDKDFNIKRNQYYSVRIGDTVRYGLNIDYFIILKYLLVYPEITLHVVEEYSPS